MRLLVYLSNQRNTAFYENNTMVGASCTAGPFSTASMIQDASVNWGAYLRKELGGEALHVGRERRRAQHRVCARAAAAAAAAATAARLCAERARDASQLRLEAEVEHPARQTPGHTFHIHRLPTVRAASPKRIGAKTM